METSYLLKANNEQAIERIASLWSEECDVVSNSFEGYFDSIYDVMEAVIKLLAKMEASTQKDDFTITGICESDYDCSIFEIKYAGDCPRMKAHLAGSDIDEDIYNEFLDADYDDIPNLLQDDKSMTFEEAVDDENYDGDFPLGGFLNVPYNEWVASILRD